MALSNMQIYNQEIYENTIELLGQNLAVFNEASGGAITLDADAFRGDFSKSAFFQQLAGAQRRVNRLGANNSVAATALSQSEIVGVKVAGGFGPVIFEPSQLTYLQENPGEAITAISAAFADALLADQLNTAVGCAVAAIENQAALVNDVSALTAGAGALTQQVLNGSHAKFGDMSSMLQTDIMTGAAYHKLIDNALVNGAELFSSENVTVIDILGKIVIKSDIPALVETGTPNKGKVLSLCNQGVIVDNSSDIVTNLDTRNGNERIDTTWQADYTFGVKLKGYAWDITNGGASPDDTALFTGSNWDKAVADNKHTAGTLAVYDLDQ